MSALRAKVPVGIRKDPKEELDAALSKLKRKMKESGLFDEYLSHQYYRRPAVRIKDKRQKARVRSKKDRKKFQ